MARGAFRLRFGAIVLALSSPREVPAFVVPTARRLISPSSLAHISQQCVGRQAQARSGRVTPLIAQVAGGAVENPKELSTDEDDVRVVQIQGLTEKVCTQRDSFSCF